MWVDTAWADPVSETATQPEGLSQNGLNAGLTRPYPEDENQPDAIPGTDTLAEDNDNGSLVQAETISRVVNYDANAGFPDFADRIYDENGREYRLESISDPYPTPGVVYERTYSVTVERPIEVSIVDAGSEAIRQSFDPVFHISQDGFAGTIPLQGYQADPVYADYEEVVEFQLVYYGLPDADISGLPQYYEFTVESNEYPGAKCEKVLQRLAVSTEASSYESDGRPATYTAVLTFRGLQTKLIIAYYQVTAVYEGLVPAVQKMLSVEAYYTLVPLDEPLEERTSPTAGPAPVTEPKQVDEPTVSGIAMAPAFIWLFGAISLVVIFAGLPLLYFLLRPDARLVAIKQDRTEKMLLSRRLVMRTEGQAQFADADSSKEGRTMQAEQAQKLAIFIIPDTFKIDASEAENHLLLSGSRYKKAAFIEIRYRGRLLYRAAPNHRLDVGRSLISAATEAIVIDGEDEAEYQSDTC
ncbi:MAG: hypothetical protein FWH40_02700 [Coriobacteriia bacterium]|nr:hypothetical protein [Coriobacteriia bacterium]